MSRLSRGRGLVGAVLVAAMAVGLWGVLFAAYGGHDASSSAGEAVVDHFDRVDGAGLGALSHGPGWRVVTGRWQVVDGAASGRPALPGGRALAVLDVGSGVNRVRAEVAAIEPGWGLATRFRDASNLWYARLTDHSGGVALFAVVGGTALPMGAAPDAHVRVGSTVEVRSTDHEVSVWVDGTAVLSRTDDRLADDHEDAGADRAADAERHQVQRPDRAAQAAALAVVVGLQLLAALAVEDPAPGAAAAAPARVAAAAPCRGCHGVRHLPVAKRSNRVENADRNGPHRWVPW